MVLVKDYIKLKMLNSVLAHDLQRKVDTFINVILDQFLFNDAFKINENACLMYHILSFLNRLLYHTGK